MEKIIPYKQTYSHSCLVADFLMLAKSKYGIKFGPIEEQEILIKGMKRKYAFYVVGIPKEFYNKFKKKINLVVDNQYFTDVLIKEFKDKKNFNIYQHKINSKFIRELLKENSLICHIDDNYFGDYSHASHFIILEKATEKNIQYIAPMTGKKGFVSDKKLDEAILSLKNHIKMCPLIYYL